MNIRNLFLPFGTSSNKQIFYNVLIYIILLIIIIASILLPLIWHFMFKKSNSSSEIVPNLQPILITKQPTLQPFNKYYNNQYQVYLIINLVNIVFLNKINIPTIKILHYSNNTIITPDHIDFDNSNNLWLYYTSFFNNKIKFDKITLNFGNDKKLTKKLITDDLSNMFMFLGETTKKLLPNKDFTISVDQDSDNSWIATLKLL